MQACIAQIGIDFRDADDHPLLAQGLRRALADVAVADQQGALAGQQVVGGALDRVVQAVPATVAVVVLGLGDRVVDVQRRHPQLSGRHQRVQAMHAGGGLLADAVHPVQAVREALVQDLRQVAAVIENHVGAPWLPARTDGLLDAPDVLRLGLAFPREHRNPGGGHGRGGVVLGGKDVARRPAQLGAQGRQGLHQHRGLHGHMQTAQDAGAGQGLFGAMFFAHRHQRGHLAFGDADLAATPWGQTDVGDPVVGMLTSGQSDGIYDLRPRILFLKTRSHGNSGRPKWPKAAVSW